MTDMLNTASLWDRITDGPEQETDKAWNAFQIYRDMPLHGKADQKRSYGNLAALMEYQSTTTIEGWARKYRWQERVRAYDAHKGRQLMVVREMGFEEYKDTIVAGLTVQIAGVQQIINQTIETMLQTQEKEGVDPKAINQLLLAIEKADNLARRAVGMPTTYTSEAGRDVLPEETTYYAGGESDG
jgi:hypothetical protein